MTLSDINANIDAINSKITEIMQTGQEYTVVGSHSVKNPAISDLRSQLQYWERRKYRYLGYTGRTAPDFSARGD